MTIKQQKGLTIIEVMIALTLSLILTVGLTQIFVSNSQTFRVAEASARTQETGRLSTMIVSREVRNAGYWGCLGTDGLQAGRLNSILNESGFDVSALLRGLDADDGTGPGGSDRISLGGVSGDTAISVTFQPSQQAANLQVSDNSTFNENDILIVTNCKQGDVFQVTNVNSSNDVVVHNAGSVSGGPGNYTQQLSTDYNDDPDGASIFRPRQFRFYLSDNATTGNRELVMDGVSIQGSVTGTFFSPVALVENVQNFQVQLGVDSNDDGQVDSWEDPAGSGTTAGRTQADNSVAVRMSYLVRSPEDGVTDGGQRYCYPGWVDCDATNSWSQASAGDTYLYRVYTATTAMRNRL
ncbi:PilW family protein [Marinobacter szutsaonensis]